MEVLFIVVFLIVLSAIIQEINKHRKCQICEMHMNSRSKQYTVKINGKKRIVCSKCNSRIASQIHKEKFNEYFNLNSRSINNKNQTNRHISTTTKNAVWKRDQGECVQCGSNEKLEFDHIIPVSKGGSNTARNIQLLCENCNRKKYNKIQ